MALDYIAIVSSGAYPTPTPTTTRRAALAVSFGLLNITLPEGEEPSIVTKILRIGRSIINIAAGILRIGQ